MSEDHVQLHWANTPIRRRLATIRRFRRLLAERGQEIARTLTEANPTRVDAAQTLSSELIPLAEAARFLERRAAKVLRPRRARPIRKPLWLADAKAEIRRPPLGVVLVIGPANYPLFIPGVQVLQALAAGNAVVVKPGRDGTKAGEALGDLLLEAGLAPALFTMLDESSESASSAIESGVDQVILTGSASSGRAVLDQCARTLTPATVELSGSDSVFVLPGADRTMTARAISFGQRLNSGATCIAPRRVFAIGKEFAERGHDGQTVKPLDFCSQLAGMFKHLGPLPVDPAAADRAQALVDHALWQGARLAVGQRIDENSMTPMLVVDPPKDSALVHADLFVPVCTLMHVDDLETALALERPCPYALGSSIFGPSDQATALAPRLRAGSVCINDLIAPTADPRIPFGGRDQSGFGSTRGEEGLLALTAVQTISQRRGRFRPHYDPPSQWDITLLDQYLKTTHSHGFGRRIHCIPGLLKTAFTWKQAKGKDQTRASDHDPIAE